MAITYLDFSHHVMEMTACLKMQTPILLNRDQGHGQQVGSPRDIPLELYEDRSLSLKMVLNIHAGHANFFIIVSNIKRPDSTMIAPINSMWCSLGHDQVEIVELLPALDHGRHVLLLVQLLQRVVWLPLPHRVEEYLLLGVGTFADIVLPHPLGESVRQIRQLRINIVSVRVLNLASSIRRAKEECIQALPLNELLHRCLLNHLLNRFSRWPACSRTFGCWLGFSAEGTERLTHQMAIIKYK